MPHSAPRAVKLIIPTRTYWLDDSLDSSTNRLVLPRNADLAKLIDGNLVPAAGTFSLVFAARRERAR